MCHTQCTAMGKEFRANNCNKKCHRNCFHQDAVLLHLGGSIAVACSWPPQSPSSLTDGQIHLWTVDGHWPLVSPVQWAEVVSFPPSSSCTYIHCVQLPVFNIDHKYRTECSVNVISNTDSVCSDCRIMWIPTNCCRIWVNGENAVIHAKCYIAGRHF